MNDEEKKAIEDIKEILELAKDEIENNDENITATLDLQDFKSLKNLYDLYNTERALNQELQIRYKIENDKYKQEKEKVEKQQKEIKKYKKYIEDKVKIGKSIQTFINLGYVEQEYISKDKIKELKQIIHNTLNKNGITRGYQQIIDKYFDELLEEK